MSPTRKRGRNLVDSFISGTFGTGVASDFASGRVRNPGFSGQRPASASIALDLGLRRFVDGLPPFLPATGAVPAPFWSVREKSEACRFVSAKDFDESWHEAGSGFEFAPRTSTVRHLIPTRSISQTPSSEARILPAFKSRCDNCRSCIARTRRAIHRFRFAKNLHHRFGQLPASVDANRRSPARTPSTSRLRVAGP